MNSFELAKQKGLKRHEKWRKYIARADEKPVPALLIPKEKAPPTEDAIVEMKVTLPHTEFTMRWVKPRVMQNVRFPNRLERGEFERHIEESLRPLLGKVIRR